MKKLLLLLSLSICIGSCKDADENQYSGRSMEVELFQASTYAYKGTVEFKELVDGNLELKLRMDGAKSSTAYAYPAHLSTTQLGKLSDGRSLKFEDLNNFDGHVKIHLANEGPEYAVILVAGNIGVKARAEFDPDRIAVCGKSF